jgi:hypothetical protein
MNGSNGNGLEERRTNSGTTAYPAASLHPAWLIFVRYCTELQHGEIERLKIQNGLPFMAEVTRKKIKFDP